MRHFYSMKSFCQLYTEKNKCCCNTLAAHFRSAIIVVAVIVVAVVVVVVAVVVSGNIIIGACCSLVGRQKDRRTGRQADRQTNSQTDARTETKAFYKSRNVMSTRLSDKCCCLYPPTLGPIPDQSNLPCLYRLPSQPTSIVCRA